MLYHFKNTLCSSLIAAALIGLGLIADSAVNVLAGTSLIAVGYGIVGAGIIADAVAWYKRRQQRNFNSFEAGSRSWRTSKRWF